MPFYITDDKTTEAVTEYHAASLAYAKARATKLVAYGKGKAHSVRDADEYAAVLTEETNAAQRAGKAEEHLAELTGYTLNAGLADLIEEYISSTADVARARAARLLALADGPEAQLAAVEETAAYRRFLGVLHELHNRIAGADELPNAELLHAGSLYPQDVAQ